MMDINKLTGAKIKELRTEMGIEAKFISLETGIDKSTLSKIENGKMDITLTKLEQIAKVLQVPITNLLNNSASIQINRDNSNNNFLHSTQVNQSDPNIKDMFFLILEKLNQK